MPKTASKSNTNDMRGYISALLFVCDTSGRVWLVFVNNVQPVISVTCNIGVLDQGTVLREETVVIGQQG